MKKFALLLSLLVCGIAFSSCEDKKEDESGYHTYLPPATTSLAESVCMFRYALKEAEGSYDGTALRDLDPIQSTIDVLKVSDTEIYLYVGTFWNDAEFEIIVPVIPLTGKVYDVAFDVISDKAMSTYNGSAFTATTAAAKGWIREKSIKPPKVVDSRTSFGPNYYKCEIDIACMVDGKPLNLKITSVEPF